GSVSATNPAASTCPAPDAASCPVTSGTEAVAAGVVAVVVGVVVGAGVVTRTVRPLETCNVTVWPGSSREPPPGDRETTIPRGRGRRRGRRGRNGLEGLRRLGLVGDARDIPERVSKIPPEGASSTLGRTVGRSPSGPLLLVSAHVRARDRADPRRRGRRPPRH